VDRPGWEVVEVACDEACRLIGPGLASVYAIGSLAHGGFTAVASDVDVALLVEPGKSAAAAVEQIAARTRDALGDELAARLSIFHAPWPLDGAPAPPSRFPAIDRLDLLEHGRLVFGEDRRRACATPPAVEEIRGEAVSFSLAGSDPDAVAALDVATAGVRGTTKAILSPVRLWWLVEHGRVVGNDEAVAGYLAEADLPHGHLVAAALAWRQEGRIEDVERAQRMVDEGALDLHAQILSRIAVRDGLPRAAELAALADRFNRARIRASSGR
jgi:predicted nucleotidyltransferase